MNKQNINSKKTRTTVLKAAKQEFTRFYDKTSLAFKAANRDLRDNTMAVKLMYIHRQ